MDFLLAQATNGLELDNFDKLLIGLHVGVMALYFIGGLWIKIPMARAQRSIPPAQSAIVGERVGFDFTVLSWFAFIVVGISGYWLLARAGDADLASPYTLFVAHDLFEAAYGWEVFLMILFWVGLVINGLIMTFLLRPKLAGKLDPTESAVSLEPFQNRLTTAVFWIDVLAWANLVLAAGSFGAGLLIGLDHTVLRVAV
jgi:hypothetical protein